ncbi:carbohydrate ABC transporter substrate-binding protein, CUT1 family (TC 3.A.1.1.-) [Gracilibacillus orientalis]|uniref:Carbohydrate ABC transporter substrate-binding protein, CUT1 family (TC 3.A.1.1.-) n=1 Tax=Gracilibacillus orientalis TaxID=334253 RepID=A0A1I4J0U8_9BACI|nr:extracellular solute-binding protein [Gracilibacillus orientalis]SFL59646.1 carbohydrate ABC transporter substrate-binding protein, CUT1 family (TC 3.A.1.1.-) [Gracilibacillus orientalis]
MKLKAVLTLTFALMLLIIVGCSSNDEANENNESERSSSDQREINFISEDTPEVQEAKILSDFDAEQSDTDLQIETIEQNNILQQISLLAASNDLPELFKYESNQLGDLIDNGSVLNIEEAFNDLGIYEELNPAAVDLLEQLSSGRGLYALPVELNIEGFWYNKEIFDENGLEVPETWADLLTASDKLLEAGVQPFAVAGKERWPITRLINGYVIRYYGANAMEDVSNGDLSITDQGFVEAATTVQNMGQDGYFGQGVNTIDSDTALDTFLQGQAAMYYSGSWDVANFNNEDRNQIGIDNIGLFNTPLVEGGEGKLSDWSMNAGLTLSLSADKYDEQMADWVKEAFTGYGDKAMKEMGMVSGFTVENMPEDVSPLTELTLDTIDSAENAALWFEGRFNADQKLVAEQNAQLLVNGDISPEEYLELLDEELKK